MTMLGLLYGLIEGSTNDWSAFPVVSIAVGVMSFVAFAHRQRTATHPLIKPSLLKNRGFTSGMIVGLIAFAASTGLFFVLSLFLQEGLHAGPRDASLGLVPLTAGLIAASFAAMGGLVAKLGRRLVLIGLAASLVGCGWVLALVDHSGTTSGRWPLRSSSSASAPASASPRSPPSLSARRSLTKPAAPAARSARSSNSLQRSARSGSRRSSSTPQAPD